MAGYSPSAGLVAPAGELEPFTDFRVSDIQEYLVQATGTYSESRPSYHFVDRSSPISRAAAPAGLAACVRSTHGYGPNGSRRAQFVEMGEIFGHMRSFRERMAAGELVSGPFVSLTDPTASEALAGSVDFLWYDQEHTPMSPEALSSHLLACRTKKTPAFVRITGPNDGDHQPWGAWIKPVLDMGADGVILPQVRTVEEVEGIVADCRFPPVGRRGRGFLGGHFDYGFESCALASLSVVAVLSALTERMRDPGWHVANIALARIENGTILRRRRSSLAAG